MAVAKLLAEWFWTDRWMGSSGFLLPMEARGIYREMLTQAWRRGGGLPNDHQAIRRAIGATEKEWRRSWPAVEPFWRVDGETLVNDTQLEVYAEAQGVAQRASQRGLRGAQARAQARAQAKPNGEARPQLEHKPPSPTPTVAIAKNAIAPARERGTNPTDFSDAVRSRVDDFIERYKALYTKYRHGAHYVGTPQSNFREAALLCETFDDERLDKLAAVFLQTDHEFAEKGSRTLAQFRSMASWCDSKLRERGL